MVDDELVRLTKAPQSGSDTAVLHSPTLPTSPLRPAHLHISEEERNTDYSPHRFHTDS